jgi:hypothetical protein
MLDKTPRHGAEGTRLQTSCVDAAASPSDLRLLTHSFDTTEVDISGYNLPSLGQPSLVRESPDDLFVDEYRLVLGERSRRTLQKLDEPRRALNRFMISGDSYLSDRGKDDTEPLLVAHTCDQFMTRDGRDVCWVRYLDTRSEAFLAPNLRLFDSNGGGIGSEDLTDAQRVERFFAGDVRVVLTARDEGAEVEIFATPECESELIEHFLLAIRGTDHASYLHYLWQREVSGVLQANGLSVFHDSPDDFVRDETVTSCVSHSSGSQGVADCLDLEVTARDPRNPLFVSLCGAQSIACRMIFHPDAGRSWQPPRFEWSVLARNR